VVGRKGTTTASGDLEGNIFTNQGKNYLHFEFPIWWPVRGQGHGDGATDRGKKSHVNYLHFEFPIWWPVRGQGHGGGATDRGKESIIMSSHSKPANCKRVGLKL
jgi:hypothetical protein